MKMRLQSLMVEAQPCVCKRCGCDDVAWNQNKKGKWYLMEGGYCHPDLKDTNFMLFNKTRFHNCDKYLNGMKEHRKQFAQDQLQKSQR